MNFEKTLNLFKLLGVSINNSFFVIFIRIVLISFSFYNFCLVLFVPEFEMSSEPLVKGIGLLAYLMLSLNLIMMTVTSACFSKHNTKLLQKLQELDILLVSDLKLKNQKKENFVKHLSLVLMMAFILVFIPSFNSWALNTRKMSLCFFVEILSFFSLACNEICFIFFVDLITYRLRSLACLSELLSGKFLILSFHSKLFSISKMINISFGKTISLTVFGQCVNVVVCVYWGFCAFLTSEYHVVISKLSKTLVVD